MSDSLSSRGAETRCEVCGGEEAEELHTQVFVLPGDRVVSYDVVACTGCGFTFARNLPSKEAYDRYYAANRKYAYEGSASLPAGIDRIHEDAFRMVDAHLRASATGQDRDRCRILDVGCSTGHLVSLFRSGGYPGATGFDPAPECRVLAKRLYDVEIETGSIFSYEAERPFDAVLLSSVLEHLPDLRMALDRMARLVSEGGLLFVEVPDADNFGLELQEPFLEFSIEHVNYFSEASLSRLLSGAGFEPVEVIHRPLVVQRTPFPGIDSVWRKTGRSAEHLPSSDPESVRRYVRASRAKLESTSAMIDALVTSREEIVVWGVGSLTARLLATTRLSEMNIRRFVDSNSGLHGTTLTGRPVDSPETLRDDDVTVLVSSFVWADEIRRTLQEKLLHRGRTVLL